MTGVASHFRIDASMAVPTADSERRMLLRVADVRRVYDDLVRMRSFKWSSALSATGFAFFGASLSAAGTLVGWLGAGAGTHRAYPWVTGTLIATTIAAFVIAVVSFLAALAVRDGERATASVVASNLRQVAADCGEDFPIPSRRGRRVTPV